MKINHRTGYVKRLDHHENYRFNKSGLKEEGNTVAFRKAMAAPSLLPEFKGNVAAIRTEKYWDRELTAAKAKDNEIKQRAKKKNLAFHLKP